MGWGTKDEICNIRVMEFLNLAVLRMGPRRVYSNSGVWDGLGFILPSFFLDGGWGMGDRVGGTREYTNGMEK